MGLIKKYFSNTRKPDGMFGKMMVSGMNKAHAEVSDWGMEHIFSMPQDDHRIGLRRRTQCSPASQQFSRGNIGCIGLFRGSHRKNKTD